VLLWIAVRFVVAAQAPKGFCSRTAACAPEIGAGWWSALLLTSVYLVRLWPLAATIAACAYAVADGWWTVVNGGYSAARPVVELVYGVACAAHMFYLRGARNRQRGYALARAIRIGPRTASGKITSPWWLSVGVGALLGAALVSIPQVFLTFVVDTGDVAAIEAARPALVAGGLVVGALAGWRWERLLLRAVRTPAVGLPVDACLGLNRTIHLYSRGTDEPFARYRASRSPDSTLSRADVGDVFTGFLYGDLSAAGFAAFTNGDTTFVPATRLAGPQTADNPRLIRDAPTADATAEAVVTTGRSNKTTTLYLLTPNEITRTRSSARSPEEVDSIRINDIRKVRLVASDRNNPERLQITSDNLTLLIPRSAYTDLAFILGERLRQQHREDVAADDKTRIHLGFVGPRRKVQHHPHQDDVPPFKGDQQEP
jgi:hypothetical protein